MAEYTGKIVKRDTKYDLNLPPLDGMNNMSEAGDFDEPSPFHGEVGALDARLTAAMQKGSSEYTGERVRKPTPETNQTSRVSTPQEQSMGNKAINAASKFIYDKANTGLGALRGAAGIGATIAQPFQALTGGALGNNAEMRKNMDENISRMGANTEAPEFEGGKLASEMAITWPVAGALGTGAKAIGLEKVGNLLKTGGIGTKLPEGAGLGAKLVDKLGNTASRLTAGGALGGVSAGLSEPEKALEGAGYGAAFGLGLPMVSSIGGYIGGGIKNIGDTIGASLGSKGSVERLTTQAIDKISGNSKDKIVKALAKSKLDEINKVGASSVPNYKQTVSQVLAQQQIGKPDQFGGGVIRLQKDLTGASGVEDALTGTKRANAVALKDFQKSVNNETTPLREKALAGVDKAGGIDTSKLTQQIDEMRNADGISKLAKKTLKGIKKDIIDKSVDGKISGKAIYTTRKEIGEVIKTHSQSTQNWDKKVTGKLERDIQLKIDDAIKSSGGEGWDNYLRTHSNKMKNISDIIASEKEAKLIASSVKPMLPSANMDGEIPQLPSLLSRPMMAINYGLKIASKDATKPIEKEVVNALQNPDLFSKYLSKKEKSKRIAEALIKQATIGGTNIAVKEN